MSRADWPVPHESAKPPSVAFAVDGRPELGRAYKTRLAAAALAARPEGWALDWPGGFRLTVACTMGPAEEQGEADGVDVAQLAAEVVDALEGLLFRSAERVTTWQPAPVAGTSARLDVTCSMIQAGSRRRGRAADGTLPLLARAGGHEGPEWVRTTSGHPPTGNEFPRALSGPAIGHPQNPDLGTDLPAEGSHRALRHEPPSSRKRA